MFLLFLHVEEELWPTTKEFKYVVERNPFCEERNKPVGKVFDLPVNPCSDLHLWSWAVGSDWKKSEVVDTRGQREFPSRVKEETQGEELDIQRKPGAEPLQRWARASDWDRRIPLEVFQTRSTTRTPWGWLKVGEIIYLIWPGSSLRSPRRSGKVLLGSGTSGLPGSARLSPPPLRPDPR